MRKSDEGRVGSISLGCHSTWPALVRFDASTSFEYRESPEEIGIKSVNFEAIASKVAMLPQIC